MRSLSGRFLILTIIFVMIAEVLIFVPSVARFRQDYFVSRLERAEIASFALLENDMLAREVQLDLLENVGVFNIALLSDERRELVLARAVPDMIARSFDMREASSTDLIRDAVLRMVTAEPEIIRVIGTPMGMQSNAIEVTMSSEGLRREMYDYGLRVLLLSALISVMTALLLFVAVQALIVGPIRKVVTHMRDYAAAPEDLKRMIVPNSNTTELRDAEHALEQLQTELTSALHQKDRLAQLGVAVSKISHDLRNILTSAQLFSDRLESSEDPLVKRLAPKLINAITRAVNLCEGTLAYGKAAEPAPRLERVGLRSLVEDVFEGERIMAGDQRIFFNNHIPEDFSLRADREQLFRIIDNLVRNAAQALAQSQSVGEVTVSAYEEADDWWVEVADNGPGLPIKARENLFTPFRGGVRKDGIGLGLAIAAELSQGHGGALELDRSGPEGTVFSLRLPKQI